MKRFRVGLVAFCLFLATSLSIFIPSVVADWSMYRADAPHTGVGTGGPVLNPVILWNFTTNGTIGDPAVVGGVVYFGSEDGNVYAINSSDASLIWNCSVLKHIEYSTPAVADGYLLISSHALVPELKHWTGPTSITYYVDALNASNGKKL